MGVTFSFLITSPLVNEVAVAMFAGTFGWKVTTIYVISGISLGMIGGYLLGKMKLEKHLSPWVQQMLQTSNISQEEMKASQSSLIGRLPQITKEALGIVRGVLLYVIIGIGIGAAIHGYVPSGFFMSSTFMKILILCTGNSCRSQMAHGFLQSFTISSRYINQKLSIHKSFFCKMLVFSNSFLRVTNCLNC